MATPFGLFHNMNKNDQYIAENYLIESDRDIASFLNISKDAVFRARKRMGLHKGVVEKALVESGVDYNWKAAWVKTEGVSTLVQNPDSGIDTVDHEAIRAEFVASMKAAAPKFPTIKYSAKKDNGLLIIDPADLHVGKRVVSDDYDPIERCMVGVSELLRKAKGHGISQILFVVGNDLLHVDNPANTTTGGTKQDVTQMWQKSYLQARRVITACMSLCVQQAPVHVIHNSGNHDEVSSYMLADAVRCWFSNTKDFTWDIETGNRKYYRWGDNLLGFTHGHAAKDDKLGLLMSAERPKDWGEVNARHIYLHHFHHRDALERHISKDHIGYTVDYLRSPSPADQWHDINGFVNRPAMDAFIHDHSGGQSARFTHWY